MLVCFVKVSVNFLMLKHTKFLVYLHDLAKGSTNQGQVKNKIN